VVCVAFAVPAVAVMGGRGEVADGAVLYLRLSALGVPWALVALAGQGYLRGAHDLRTPLIIVVLAHALNVVLEVLFVYGFRWGLAGSAWGTVIAQTGMGLAFAWALWRAPAADRRPSRTAMRPLLRVGGDIFVRTTALYASFTVASAVLARVSAAALGAHQIAFQIFVFLALVLDAVAIAAQVMVGRMLGAGEADRAYAAGRHMIGWSLAVGAGFGVALLALTNVLPEAFTDDPAVLRQAHEVWPLFALMQPFAGIVFALDGILIGASDTRFLKWSMVFAALGVYVPVAIASLEFGWGIVGVWCGLLGLMAARLLTCGGRFLGRRWALTGAPSAI
jgi:putative MATE family efflux protein